jgi:hypothetical protein
MTAMDLGWATEQVAALLELRDAGERTLELVSPRQVTPPEAAEKLREASPAGWFPAARSPQGAFAGLWLYFGAFEEAHEIVQDLDTPEGSYWHALIHRMEPDAWNSGYWFRRVGHHAIFPALLEKAIGTVATHPDCGFVPGDRWSPERFTAFCAVAHGRPGSPAEHVAREIQSSEWRLLFAWCGMRR